MSRLQSSQSSPWQMKYLLITQSLLTLLALACAVHSNPPTGDFSGTHRDLLFDIAEIRQYIRHSTTIEEVLTALGQPSTTMTFDPPMPKWAKGEPFPVDKILSYSAANTSTEEIAYKGITTRAVETQHITFMFFRGKMRFAFIWHMKLDKNGKPYLVSDSSQAILDNPNGLREIWPGGSCDDDYYRKMILGRKVSYGWTCEWHAPDIERRLREKGYYTRLKNGYTRDPAIEL